VCVVCCRVSKYEAMNSSVSLVKLKVYLSFCSLSCSIVS